jgi:hypothetical protein
MYPNLTSLSERNHLANMGPVLALCRGGAQCRAHRDRVAVPFIAGASQETAPLSCVRGHGPRLIEGKRQAHGVSYSRTTRGMVRSHSDPERPCVTRRRGIPPANDAMAREGNRVGGTGRAGWWRRSVSRADSHQRRQDHHEAASKRRAGKHHRDGHIVLSFRPASTPPTSRPSGIAIECSLTPRVSLVYRLPNLYFSDTRLTDSVQRTVVPSSLFAL